MKEKKLSQNNFVYISILYYVYKKVLSIINVCDSSSVFYPF